MLPFLTHQYILLLAAGSDSKKRFCPVVQLCPLSVRRKRSKEEAKWKCEPIHRKATGMFIRIKGTVAFNNAQAMHTI